MKYVELVARIEEVKMAMDDLREKANIIAAKFLKEHFKAKIDDMIAINNKVGRIKEIKIKFYSGEDYTYEVFMSIQERDRNGNLLPEFVWQHQVIEISQAQADFMEVKK